MRSWLRSTSSRVFGLIGSFAFLVFAASLFSAAPVHPALAQECGDTTESGFCAELTQQEEETEEDTRKEYNSLLGCDYSAGYNKASGNAGYALIGDKSQRRKCKNNATMMAMGDGLDNDMLANYLQRQLQALAGHTQQIRYEEPAYPSPKSQEVQYFVKDQPQAVMACAVRFKTEKAAAVSPTPAVMTEAVSAPVAIPVVFNTPSPSFRNPLDNGLRRLVAGVNAGPDFMGRNCGEVPGSEGGNGVCSDEQGDIAKEGADALYEEFQNYVLEQDQMDDLASNQGTGGILASSLGGVFRASLLNGVIPVAASGGKREPVRAGAKSKNKYKDNYDKNDEGQGSDCNEQKWFDGRGCGG